MRVVRSGQSYYHTNMSFTRFIAKFQIKGRIMQSRELHIKFEVTKGYWLSWRILGAGLNRFLV